MKCIVAFFLLSSGLTISSLAQDQLPAPFPEVGKTYFIRYSPGVESVHNTIKVLRVESNGWILAEVPNTKSLWINPGFIAMANLIESAK